MNQTNLMLIIIGIAVIIFHKPFTELSIKQREALVYKIKNKKLTFNS